MKTKRILLSSILLFFFTLSSFADEFKKDFVLASDYLSSGNYSEALVIYQKLEKQQPDNANIQFLIGLCYLNSPLEKTKSIPYLEKASKKTSPSYQEGFHKEVNAPVDAMRYLADAYHLTYDFTKAREIYTNYKSQFDAATSQEEIREIDHMLMVCDNAEKLMETPVKLTIENLGDKINSKYADYAPVLTIDESTMIFTSRREGSTGGEKDQTGKFYEDLYVSDNLNGSWSFPKPIGNNINSNDHEATINITADGSQLLIYKFVEGSGDIFISNLEGENWSIPRKLGSDINTKSWEPHATISADGNTIYFSSDREGGLGGRDLYLSKKMPNGDWSWAQNMGPTINTIYDEDGPFMHPDGKTLYFSSKGHKGMGGFDIFTSELSEEYGWSEPVNFGYPVNTTGDDIFFVPTADGKRAFYSSYRIDGIGDQDIYMLTFPELEEKSLTVYSGFIRTRSGSIPEDVVISVVDNVTGELIGEYQPNSATGKYIIILKPGRDYNITYEGSGCFHHSDNVKVEEGSAYSIINRTVDLDPLEVGQIVRLNNIFYEYDKAELKPESETELDRVADMMKECASLKIEIAGHTDSHGSEDYNLKLSQDRADVVVKYLIDNGIEDSRLVPKGYGETTPVAPNENEDGTDNEKGRELNRRTEMKILEI